MNKKKFFNKSILKKYVKELEDPFEITFNKGVYSFHKDGEEETTRKEYVFKEEENSPFTSDNE